MTLASLKKAIQWTDDTSLADICGRGIPGDDQVQRSWGKCSFVGDEVREKRMVENKCSLLRSWICQELSLYVCSGCNG